jgi:hypothetical protein
MNNTYKRALILIGIWAICFAVFLFNSVGSRTATSSLYQPIYASPSEVDGYSPTSAMWLIIFTGAISLLAAVSMLLLGARKK